MPESNAHLRRSLGLWAVVFLGLGYMTPTVVFDTFGIVSNLTEGVVPLAYVVGLVVMMFTGISYGKMVHVYPSAGSAYTYTRKAISSHLGFMVGWCSLLDYMLLPLVNALIIRIYMHALFPEVPAMLWVFLYVAGVTWINVVTMKGTSNLNSILVVFEVVLIAAFIFLAWRQLAGGMGQGTIMTLRPLWHAGVEIGAVLTGATVVCFSFIGFDAITMYTEEVKDSKVMPRAILLTILIGGLIFFIGGYFAQALFPDLDGFVETDDTLPEIALYTGGKLFQLLFLAGAFAATIASGLASHASVARLIYVMGRDGVLPKRFFGYVHPRLQTPIFDVILVGVISLAAVFMTLEFISAVINFGALIAFTFVNLTVIAHFVVRQKRYKTARDLFIYLVLPAIGAGLTGLLWINLSQDALIGGVTWTIIGIVYLAILTRGFTIKLDTFSFDE